MFGASWDDTQATDTGAAYVYRYDGDTLLSGSDSEQVFVFVRDDALRTWCRANFAKR